jgi:hypothetical protein
MQKLQRKLKQGKLQKNLFIKKNTRKWTGRDLNPRPLPCQGSDLPADLPALPITTLCSTAFKRVGRMQPSWIFSVRKRAQHKLEINPHCIFVSRRAEAFRFDCQERAVASRIGHDVANFSGNPFYLALNCLPLKERGVRANRPKRPMKRIGLASFVSTP